MARSTSEIAFREIPDAAEGVGVETGPPTFVS
jgi:hypothetical protein